MKIAVLREGGAGERRVAAVPETVKKFIGLGATMAVETGAGSTASVSDAEYEAAGASVADRASVLKDADIILFDENIRIQATFVRGRMVYSASENAFTLPLQ